MLFAQNLGSTIKVPGEALGAGLSSEAALELGLHAGTPVAVSVIDAYAGALGLLASRSEVSIEARLGTIHHSVEYATSTMNALCRFTFYQR